MKKVVLLTLSLIAFVTVSCKDDKKQETNDQPEQKEAPAKENFYVEMDAQADKKDDLALYYTEDGTNNYTPEKALWRTVNPGEQQTLVYDLPLNVLPSNIRLDFGTNKAQEWVTVSRIKFAHQGNNFEIKGSEFLQYFDNNVFKTEVDSVKGTITFKKDGNTYVTPYYTPNVKLVEKLSELSVEKH